MTIPSFHWKDSTPSGVAPMIQLYPRERKTPEEVLAEARREWTDKSQLYGLQLQMGDYRGYGGALLFTGDVYGIPTVDDIAQHMRRGRMAGYEREYGDWFEQVLELLRRDGYQLGMVFIDNEGQKLTRDWQCKDNHGNLICGMPEVVRYLQENYPARLPKWNVDLLEESGYDWGAGAQAMIDYNHWVTKKIWQACVRTFTEPAREMFGTDCIVAYYDQASYRTDLLDPASRYPRLNYAPGGASCPVLYQKKDEYYKTLGELLQAWSITTGKFKAPIVMGHNRVGMGAGDPDEWLCTTEDVDAAHEAVDATADMKIVY